MLDPILIVELVAMGIFSGLLAGIFGIGGGMITVPLLIWAISSRNLDPELTIKMAIATSMATIVLNATFNTWSQWRRGAVRWDIVRTLTPGIVIGSLIVSIGIFSLIKGNLLQAVFGCFLVGIATNMLRARKFTDGKSLPSPALQMLMGVFIGLASGLVGAGGGFLSVPWMSARGIPIKTAIATSAVLGLPIALFNTSGYIYSGWGQPNLPEYTLGYVFLPAFAVLGLASALTVPLGVHVSHRLPVVLLRRFLALLLYLMAAYMLYRSWRGFTHG